jgi:hypothetical protein
VITWSTSPRVEQNSGRIPASAPPSVDGAALSFLVRKEGRVAAGTIGGSTWLVAITRRTVGTAEYA